MQPEQCPNWGNCNSPICPLDVESLENAVSYEDDEKCKMWEDRKWRMTLPKKVLALYRKGQILRR